MIDLTGTHVGSQGWMALTLSKLGKTPSKPSTWIVAFDAPCRRARGRSAIPVSVWLCITRSVALPAV